MDKCRAFRLSTISILPTFKLVDIILSFSVPAQYPLTQRSAASWDMQPSNSLAIGSTGEVPPPVLTTPAMMSGDPLLEAISNSISQQREMLLRLENEQQRRLLQMHAEAEERRRREAEAYERELAQQREKQR